MAVDGQGNVYVADTYNNRIQKFDGNGTFQTVWASSGTGNGQFSEPNAVAVDGQGNIYVTEPFRIQKFDSRGNFLAVLSGAFNYPQGLAIDGQGQLYVADTVNNRIQKFDPNGNFIKDWGQSGRSFTIHMPWRWTARGR